MATQTESSGPGASLTMVRRDLLALPEMPFPKGFGVRPLSIEDAKLWAKVWNGSDPFTQVGDDMFVREFGSDPQAVPERCFFILDEAGDPCGTISAWYANDFHGEPWGRIHWVGICREFQGRGLGKAAVAFALEKLVQWHDRVFLKTESRRVPAITLYLDFGFLPDLEFDSLEVWESVAKELEHPALLWAIEQA